MPVDQYEEIEEEKDSSSPEGKRFREFDCPGCNANNPCPEPISDGDEVLCNYCGTEFQARVSGEGRLKLREI